MNTWIIPCNVKYYDIVEHFSRDKRILWKGVSNTAVGDIVYLYLGRPYSEIRYKGHVTEINISFDDVKKSGISILLKESSRRKNIIQIELDKEYPEGLLKFQLLKGKGLVSVQSQMRIPESLNQFLNSQE